MKMKILSLLSALCIITTANSAVQASSIEVTQNKRSLDVIESEKGQIEGKLGEVNTKTEAASKEIAELDAQMATALDEYNKIEEELKAIEENILGTRNEIKEAEEILERRKNLFGDRLSAMYKMGEAGYIDVILGSEDIIDLFNRVGMIKEVVSYDTEVIEEIKKNKREIAGKEESLEEEESKVRELVRDAEVKKVAITKVTSKKTEYLDTLREDEFEYRSQLEKMDRESEAIIKEIMKEENGYLYGQNEYTGYDYSDYVGLLKPYTGGVITSEFGVNRSSHNHGGIDIGIPTGTPILAAESGQIAESHYSSSYGEVVYINHGDGMVTIYAHNSKRLVSKGDTVLKGQIIAYSGSTGRSTGPHLHFEIVINGKKVNPREFINF